MFNVETLPVSSALVAGVVVWGAVSALVLGPLVAERSIDAANWSQTCVARLTQPAISNDGADAPMIGCRDVETVFGNSARGLCMGDTGQTIDGFIGLMTRMNSAAQVHSVIAQQERRARQEAAQMAPSRCDCAAATLASERTTWGLHAGTLRLAGGPGDLEAALLQALHGPDCAYDAGGRR